MEKIYAILNVVVFIMAAASIISMIYHFSKMFGDMRPSARRWANWLPFVVPFLPGSYTEVGEKHLAKGTVSLIVAVSSMFGLSVLGGASGSS